MQSLISWEVNLPEHADILSFASNGQTLRKSGTVHLPPLSYTPFLELGFNVGKAQPPICTLKKIHADEV